MMRVFKRGPAAQSRTRPAGPTTALVCCALSLCGLLATGCLGKPASKPSATPTAATTPSPVKVDVARAVSRSIAQDVDLVGSVAALRVVNLAPAVSGRITEVSVDMGDPVATGQVLMRIQSTDAQMQVRVSQAQLAQSKAQSGLYWADGKERDAADVPAVRKARAVMDNDHKKYEEYQRLRQEELISDQNLADARQTYLSSKADYEAAMENVQSSQASIGVSQAQVEANQAKLPEYVVTSPLDGWVQQRSVTAGDVASAGNPTGLVLVSGSPLLAAVDVPQRYAARLREGDLLEMSCDARPEVTLRAYIRRMSPVARADTRAIPVQAVLQNPPVWLRPGMLVRVRLQMEAPLRHVMVPDAAILTQSGQSSVFVVQPGTGGSFLVKSRPIKTGQTIQDWTEVEGVQSGEQVVASDLVGLADGDAITPGTEIPAPRLREDAAP